MIDLQPIWLSLRLALLTTALLMVLGIPLARWLAYRRFRLKALVEAIISLPLVLPPTVLGFYLLLAFSPEHAFGHFLDKYFDTRLAFTFNGIVIASLIYSLPFMVHPLRAGLKNLPPSLREVSYTLGKSSWATLWQVLLPNIRPALATGFVLSFAHTLGEFGVVLMVGGNIPGKTRVASLALYDEVLSMNYHNANIYAAILLAISFLILLSISIIRSPNQNTDLVS